MHIMNTKHRAYIKVLVTANVLFLHTYTQKIDKVQMENTVVIPYQNIALVFERGKAYVVFL